MTINKSQQIRDYAAANPAATAREISTTLGVKPTYVHTILWKTKQKPAEKKSAPKKGRPAPKKWKTLHVSTSDNSVEQAMEKEVTTAKYAERMMELAYQAGMGRDRVHPVTGKILMQGADPLPITMHDPVNHPAHYKVGGIETIDFIEAKKLNYNLGNVVKYITRADHKGSRKQDLEKAIWYLKRELDHSV
jgi:hypothetical protein